MHQDMVQSICLYTEKRRYLPYTLSHLRPTWVCLAFGPHINTLIFPCLDVLQGPLEVLSGALKSADIFCCVEVALDQLNQAVDVFGCDSVVLLVKVVDVAVEDFDEEFDAHSSVHASISNAESTLQALEDTLAVAVGLSYCQQMFLIGVLVARLTSF